MKGGFDMKKIISVLMIAVIGFSFSGCCLLYDYEMEAVDNFDVGYSNVLDNAFLSTYNWDGTDETTKLVIPNEYEGIPITTFGGYFGRGVPCCFCIEPTEYAKEKLCDKSNSWFHMSDIRSIKIGHMKIIEFNIHISENIDKIENLDLGGFIGCEYIKDGTEYYDVFVLLCTITCDEKNKTFYAKDGKLYYRDGDILVADIFYYDFNIDRYMSEEKEGDGWFSAF